MVCTFGIYGSTVKHLKNPILWVNSATLQDSTADGATVMTWPGFQAGLPTATSYVLGSAPYPTFHMGPFPYVMYNLLPSTTTGCYSDFGPLTIPINTTSLTGYTVCRLRGIGSGSNYSQIWEFQTANVRSQDLFVGQNSTGNDIRMRNNGMNGDGSYFVSSSNGPITNNNWMVVLFQLSVARKSMTVNINGNHFSSTWIPPSTSMSYVTTRIAYSTYLSGGNTMAALDVAELGLWACDLPVNSLRQLSRQIRNSYGI